MEERTPDHSSPRNRLRGSSESVLGPVLEVLVERDWQDRVCRSNAALRSIVRRDHESYLKELARTSYIRAERTLALDKKRPKKGSNKEWVTTSLGDHENEERRLDMAHKAEHAVDMSGEGAVIAVTLHGGAKGDTKSLPDTLEKAQSNLQELANNAEFVNEYMRRGSRSGRIRQRHPG